MRGVAGVTGPGIGPGWERLAAVVSDRIPSAEIDGLWVFPVLRQDQCEWGTAVLTRVEGAEGERRRIYTARYMLQVKGKERGKFEASVVEVGSGPIERLPELLHEVHKRTDDEIPPVQVEPAAWFPLADDGPPQ